MFFRSGPEFGSGSAAWVHFHKCTPPPLPNGLTCVLFFSSSKSPVLPQSGPGLLGLVVLLQTPEAAGCFTTGW